MPDTTAPIAGSVRLCSHFGVCGGCSSLPIPYEQQLIEKEKQVRSVVSVFSPARFDPIRPSPDVHYYRNKMEFVFASGPDGFPVLGLREKGRFDKVVDVQDCLLMSPETPVLLAAVRDWSRREKLPAYDLKSHKGFLRYLVVREGKNTGRRLVHLVTAPGVLPEKSFLQSLENSGANVDTVVWSVNGGLSDVARGTSGKILSGEGFIREKLGPLSYRISPEGFFQTNSRGAEILYKIVADFFVEKASVLFDLYCGSGTIGLFCADQAHQVVGIELNPVAVEDALLNVREQGVPRARFLAMDADRFPREKELMDLWQTPGATAVADPPRPGLQKAVRRLLLETPLSRWVYVSCNPKALAQDLPLLRDVYQIEFVSPVDMFPHTPHVETVVGFRKRV